MVDSQKCGQLSARLEKSKILEGGIMVSERQVRFNLKSSGDINCREFYDITKYTSRTDEWLISCFTAFFNRVSIIGG